MTRKAAFVLLCVLTILSACKTVPVSQRERRVQILLDRLNERDVEHAMEVSRIPFVFDQEIIVLESDVETLWSNLEQAGFSFANHRVREIRPVHAGSYREFGDTMDMEVYFSKYLSEDGTIVHIDTDYGGFLVLVGDRRRGLPQLFGMKGPL